MHTGTHKQSTYGISLHAIGLFFFSVAPLVRFSLPYFDYFSRVFLLLLLLLFHPSCSLCLIHGTLVAPVRPLNRRNRRSWKHFIGDCASSTTRNRVQMCALFFLLSGISCCWTGGFCVFNSLVHFNGFVSYGCMYRMRATICFIWTEECPFGMHWFLILVVVVVDIVVAATGISRTHRVSHSLTWMFAFLFASHVCVWGSDSLASSLSSHIVRNFWYLFQFPNEFGLFFSSSWLRCERERENVVVSHSDSIDRAGGRIIDAMHCRTYVKWWKKKRGSDSIHFFLLLFNLRERKCHSFRPNMCLSGFRASTSTRTHQQIVSE